jgi:thiamine-monophosphate kinase
LALTCVLSGGDDYELVFTAPASARQAVLEASHRSVTPVTRIGQIISDRQVHVLDSQGQAIDHGLRSFDHFA